MKSTNICKFNINRSSDLVCHDFVLETQQAHASALQSERFLLGIVIKGAGELKRGERRYSLTEGMLFAVLRGEPFSVCGNAELQYCYIRFSGRRAEELVERVGIDSPDFEPQQQTRELADFWVDSLHCATEANTDLLAEAVLLYSLAQLRPSSRPQHDLVAKMLMLTNDLFTEADFSLSSLGKELGYDVKYLSSLFKKKKGITFTQYLRDLRIKHAIFLMEQGVVSVKNIALLSGFVDALYFSKIFKQYVGSSPKSYIEGLQNSTQY